jgi:hypothetical protein
MGKPFSLSASIFERLLLPDLFAASLGLAQTESGCGKMLQNEEKASFRG